MGSPLLHLLGAGPWQLATMRRARARGIRVLVTDGWPDRPGFDEADLHAVADLADVAATLAVARAHGVDGVLCDTTDTGVVAAAAVAEALGLPGPGLVAAQACCDKAAMQRCAAAAGLPVARSLRLDSVEAAVAAVQGGGLGPGPWVLKPVDSQSGRGVGIVHAPAQVRTAADTALAHSRSAGLLVQECLAGPEFIVDSLIVEGRVHVLGLASKTPYADNPTVASAITYFDAEVQAHAAVLHESNRRLLAALGLRQGLVHAEFIVGAGGPVPIDVAARGGGVSIYPVVLPHVSGVATLDAAMDLALGRRPALPAEAGPRGAAQVRFVRPAPGRIVAVEGLDRARGMPGIATVHLNLALGAVVGGLEHKDSRAAYVVALGADAAEAVARAERAAAAVVIRTEPVPLPVPTADAASALPPP
jgi:biotin carboxylase